MLYLTWIKQRCKIFVRLSNDSKEIKYSKSIKDGSILTIFSKLKRRKNMRNNIVQTDLTELFNHPEVAVTSYANLKEHCIEVFEHEVQETDNLIRIPYRDELCSYNQTVGEFIDEWNLIIPRKMSARRYLREQGYIQEFYAFWNEKAAKKLLEWLEYHHIKSSIIA